MCVCEMHVSEYRNMFPVHVFVLHTYVHECVWVCADCACMPVCVFRGEVLSFLRINWTPSDLGSKCFLFFTWPISSTASCLHVPYRKHKLHGLCSGKIIRLLAMSSILMSQRYISNRVSRQKHTENKGTHWSLDKDAMTRGSQALSPVYSPGARLNSH